MELLVELERYLVAAVLVIVGDQQKGRRSIGRNSIGHAATGIDEHLKVRLAILTVDGVRRGGIAGSGRIGDHGGNFASGGKAENTDAVRVDVPFVGAAAHEPHGAIRVLANVFFGVRRVRFAGQAIFQRESRYADAVEELRGLHALRVKDQFAEASAGRDDDCRTVGFFFRRQENGDRGIVYVSHPVVLRLFGNVFAALEAGRAVFPEVNHLRSRLGGGCRAERGECECREQNLHSSGIPFSLVQCRARV